MNDNGDTRKLSSVTINLGDTEGRIEKLVSKETEPVKLRISSWSQNQPHSRPLDLSEKELVNLLQKAIRAGILSGDFLKNLHSEFEI